MKFQVREGFVIHDTRLVDVNGRRVEQTNSYYEGDTVDFDADTAQQHLHKLEPQDKEAKAYAAAKTVPVSAAPVAGIDATQLSQLVAQAVAAAVAAVQAPAPAEQTPPAA